LVKATYKKKKKGRTEYYGAYMHVFGKNKMADRIGLHALTEDESNTNTATQYPIEGHNAVTDHVRRESKVMTFSILIDEGTMAKSNKIYRKLNDWGFHGKLLVFKGATMYFQHVVITNLTKHGESLETGIECSLELTYVYFTKSSVIKKGSVKNNGKKGSGGSSGSTSPKKKGQYRTSKKGDSYWLYHQKTGASIANLRKWNKYPDRAIPIGVRVRIK